MLVIRASLPQEESPLEGYIAGLEKDGELVILDEVMDDEELLERVGGMFPEVFVGWSRLAVEVTLRSAYWKGRYGISYRDLAHDLRVNLEAQWFCRVRAETGFPSFSCLQQNIAQLDEATWKRINGWIVAKARQKHHTKGLKSRKDSSECAVSDGWGDIAGWDPGGGTRGEEGGGESIAAWVSEC